MQIERTQGLDPLGLPGGTQNLPKAEQGGAATGKTGDSAGGPAGPAFQPYVARAREAEEVRLAEVEEAKRLIAAGELDTPEAAQRAAEALLRLGI